MLMPDISELWSRVSIIKYISSSKMPSMMRNRQEGINELTFVSEQASCITAIRTTHLQLSIFMRSGVERLCQCPTLFENANQGEQKRLQFFLFFACRLRPVIYSCSVRRGQLLLLARSPQQSRSGLSVEMFVCLLHKKQTHENEVFSSTVKHEDMSHHLCPLLCCVSSATRCSS